MSAHSPDTPRRITIHELQRRKREGRRWAMLTCYDALTARIFEEAGVDVLLVGDSAANTVLGYPDTLAVTTEELLVLNGAVARGATRALVVADLPFGSYQLSPRQALQTSIEFVKRAGVQAVKFEGGRRVAEHVRTVVDAGIPVMAHIGFTPQSVHALGGYRVQGRGQDAEELRKDALALQDAGAFAVVLEMIPAQLAAEITAELRIPTIGIGAGPACDAQVLVWTDMAGLGPPPMPRFVKEYADLRGVLTAAARAFVDDVAAGRYPDLTHSYQ